MNEKPYLKEKLVRITTVPLSLEKLLEGQLSYMNTYFEVVAVSSDLQGLKKVAEKERIRYFFAPLTRKITPFQDLYAVFRLYGFLKKEKPSFVHSHTPKAGIVGMTAAWLAGVPNRLHTVAGLPLMEAKGIKRRLLLFIEKLTYRLATRVYPNSKGLAEFIIQEKLMDGTKLKIIGIGSSNGIDTHFFDPVLFNDEDKVRISRETGLNSNEFTFVFIGRMVRDKGLVELIEAFTRLHSQISGVQLLLVGPMEQELDPLPETLIGQIHDHPKISYIGYQKDIRPYLAVSDLMVFPSYREGFPNVVLQALAMEIPALVTNINGCNEMVEDAYNGWVVPSKDADALFIKMKEAYIQRENLANLKTNTRRSILKYDRQIYWEAMLEEYQHLLKGIS